MSAPTFTSLGLSPWLVQTCQSMGMKQPTPIQQLSIPLILAADKPHLIAKARTGSGKTAAYTLPILHTLAKDIYGIYALILAPTRELTYQISEQVTALGAHLNIKTVTIIGGENNMHQQSLLSERPHIVIATPGRLAAHIRQNTATSRKHWKHVQYLVYDEVDRLVEDTFTDDITLILETLPDAREYQKLLFSATIDMTTEQLKAIGVEGQITDVNDTDTNSVVVTSAKSTSLRRLLRVTIDADLDNTKHTATTVNQLDQRYMFIPYNVKEVYLAYLLAVDKPDTSCIIFVNTCSLCEFISQLLHEVGIDNESLHSHKTQDRRLASLGKFRSGRCKILVATDVASRGLDIPQVQMVINYDPPRVLDDYVHRVGRTARAGRGGLAVTIVSQYDIELFQQIEQKVNVKMEEYEAPEKPVLRLLQRVNAARKLAKMHLEQYEENQKMVPEKRRKRQQMEVKALQRRTDKKQKAADG